MTPTASGRRTSPTSGESHKGAVLDGKAADGEQRPEDFSGVLTVNAAEGGGPVVKPDQPPMGISNYSEEELIGKLGKKLLLKMMARLLLGQLGL